MSDLCGYLRVSTDREVERGPGFGAQQTTINHWAQEKGHSIVLWFRDKGVSATNELGTRKGLPEAMAAVQNGIVAGLVVNRLDRLAEDLVLQELIRAEILRMGGHLFTASPAENQPLEDHPSNRSRMFVRHVVGTVDEYEQSMMGLRRQYGGAHRYQPGFTSDSPSSPGFLDAGRLRYQSLSEQEILSRISELRAMCRSLREIAAALTTKRIKPGPSETRPTASLRLVVNRTGES